MNRFKTRRKAKDAEAQGDVQPLSSPSFGTKSFRKPKKQAPEPKIELDLASALPSTDDFRTSMMMTSLSARFSMLREQDDPTTKIGKANDDSVLFPKRASRLNLFAHNPLTDIAEVESLRGSVVRPPFAQEGRTSSFASDGYASDDGGSMMGRSKPGEGNNLFGGRQKLYRIPVASTRTLSGSDSTEKEPSTMVGRHMYEKDVSMSMFQKIREQEREERLREEAARLAGGKNLEGDETELGHHSPSMGFSKDRGTTSSTTSGPSGRRTSTAATSVNSEAPMLATANGSSSSLGYSKPSFEDAGPLERVPTTQRKLYGQGLEQNSPTHRAVRNVMEGTNRPRAATSDRKPYAPSPQKNVAAPHPKNRPAPVYTSASFRTASPPPGAISSGLVPMDLGIRDSRSHDSIISRTYGASPPLSPPASDGEDMMTYTHSVQPEDRGKATAMGLFNRPQRQYDEQQFTQRQMQMHEGRISPIPQRYSPAHRDVGESPNPAADWRAAASTPPNMDEVLQSDQHLAPGVESQTGPPHRLSPRLKNGPPSGPPSANSATLPLPLKQSKLSGDVISRARARAESLIRRQNAELAALEEERQASKSVKSQPSPSSALQHDAASGTFLDNFSPSDDEPESSSDSSTEVALRRPPSDVHPALRDGTHDFVFDTASPAFKSPPRRPGSDTQTAHHSSFDGNVDPFPTSLPTPTETTNLEPPSFPQQGGLGLSGMIRSHLRHDSDKSSIYPTTSVHRRSEVYSVESPRVGQANRVQNPPESIHSNPWEFDDIRGRQNSAEETQTAPDTMMTMSQKAKQILGQATALQNQAQAKSKAQQILGEEAPSSGGESHPQRSWQEEMRLRHHQRGGSSDTQTEKDEFSHELAERRKRLQENLRSIVETESRPISPSRGAFAGPGGAMSALKHKTSKASMRTRPGEPQNKAMKMLGITSPTTEETSPRMPQDDMWREEEERMLNDFQRRKPKSPMVPQRPYAAQPRPESPNRGPPRPFPMQRRPGSPSRAPHKQYALPSRPESPRFTPSPHDDFDRRQRSVTPTSSRYPSRPRDTRDRANSNVSGGRSKSRTGQYRDDVERGMTTGVSGRETPYEDSKRPSIITLPRPSVDMADQHMYERSASAMSGRARSNSRSTAPGYFDSKPMPSSDANLVEPPPMPTPNQAYSANSTPPLSTVSTPIVSSHPHNPYDSSGPAPLNSRSQFGLANRKKSVNKNMIGEPMLLSSTSNIPAVMLPAPHGFHPRSDFNELSTPPLPSMNPKRRRQTTTQTMFNESSNQSRAETKGAFTQILGSQLPSQFQPEERSTFSDEGEQRQTRPRARLRKISSEGGQMNMRARQHAYKDPSPGMPMMGGRHHNVPTVVGGMF